MVAPARWTTHGAHFVDLRSTRRLESELSLSELGVKPHYGELPDGRLDTYHRSYYRHIMGIMIVSLAHKHDITTIATLGDTGYCGHFDHVATHEAALDARDILRQSGRDVTVFELDNSHQGEFVVPVDRARKLSALALHVSQGGFGPDFWHNHPHYAPLLEQETYRVS